MKKSVLLLILILLLSQSYASEQNTKVAGTDAKYKGGLKVPPGPHATPPRLEKQSVRSP